MSRLNPFNWLTIVVVAMVSSASVWSEAHAAPAEGAKPFVAVPPYSVPVLGKSKPVGLWSRTKGREVARTFDYGGDAPFVNPTTGVSDFGALQAWDGQKGMAVTLAGDAITNAGFRGRIEKRNGSTMVRYVAGDGVVAGKCRAQIVSYAIPTRTLVRWELLVAFGADNKEDYWPLTPPGQSPVLFWQVKAADLLGNPSLAAIVDTDPNDPSNSLTIFFSIKGGKTTNSPKRIGQVYGIPRNTQIPIVIEAFLDEREAAEGGLGRQRAWVNNALVVDSVGPNLQWGRSVYIWYMNVYLYNEAAPVPYSRSSFWKAAKMSVH